MRANKPEVTISSDYAVLACRNAEFYYGYERSICKSCGKTNKPGTEHCDICKDADRDWCFVAGFPGREEIVVPFSRLGAKSMFDVVDCLLIGIGWIFAKYKLERS